MGVRGVEETGGVWSEESTKQESTETAIVEPAWAGLGPLYICCSCWLGNFEGPLTVGLGMSLTLLPSLGSVFHLLSYLAQLSCEGLCFILLYLAVLCLPDVAGMYSIREE